MGYLGWVLIIINFYSLLVREVYSELSERVYEQNSVAITEVDPSQEESKVSSIAAFRSCAFQ